CHIFGNGHINTTYLAAYNDNGNLRKYVVQKVNTTVFKDIDKLMDNIFSVTSYLRKEIKKNGGDEDRETLHFIRTKSGDKYYKTESGDYYRAYIFVSDSVSYNSVDSAEIFKTSGVAFGKFQKMLSDFPANTLFEIIPDFHNTQKRYNNEFMPAVENDLSGRLNTCTDEIDFVKQRKSYCSRLVDLADLGKLPVRVTHNDTKLNNVMFDEKSGNAVCVIDLDTVMPGLALYDFGDSIRFGANTADEDEPDISKVSINLEYFKAYAQGFLSQAGNSLNQCEKDNLAFSALLMTFECGMRFLTDYLNGDTYFKIDYPTHNLVRAKNQFALVSDMEKHMDEMNNIIKNID
ncbi:MAG: aminoglycoside phosphotransferase family protein, partial [Clostridiales bacterium]|nr:aminoglycoside phosphotransferase family protein [Clostridiales bacterium]